MFTASAEINNPITINSTLDYEGELFDVVDVEIEANELKTIEMNVSNNSSETLYYTFWYINNSDSNINIGIEDYNGANTSSGSMASGASERTYNISIFNASNSTANITLGVLANTSNTFNLGTGMELVPNQKPPVLIEDYITNLFSKTGTVTSNNISHDVDTTHQLIKDPLENIRYYGTGITSSSTTYTTPNNTIYFNCDTYPDTNCEIWRIIGIVDGKVKLIRSSGLGAFSWDTNASSTYGINEWSQADLMTELNTYYYYGTLGTCYNGSSSTTVSCDFTSTGIKNDTTRNMIATATYYTRGGPSADIYPYDALTMERTSGSVTSNPSDGVTRKTTWTGKIALAYPSDYGYATDLSSSVCSSTLYNYYSSTNNYACRGNNWMWYIMTGATTYSADGSALSWLITPDPDWQYNVWRIGASGYGSQGYFANSSNWVSPVLYLNSSVVIDGTHDGSSSDPYRILIAN